jgi:hypothetical protein
MPDRTILPKGYTNNNWKFICDGYKNATNGDALAWFECILCHQQYEVRPYTVKNGKSKQCGECGRGIGSSKRRKSPEEKSLLSRVQAGHEITVDELLKYRAYSLFGHALKSKSTKSGLPFDLTLSWVEDKLRSGKCEVTGIEFILTESNIGSGKGHARPNKFAPSLDRKIPNAGYTKQNVRVVVWMYNILKSCYTDYDVQEFIDKVRKNASYNH